MTHPAERRLERVLADGEWLRSLLPKALRALATTTPDGYPGGGDAGRSTDVANPTASAAVAGFDQRRRYAEIDALSAELTGVMAELVRKVEGVPDPGVDTEKLWSQHRCCGGEGDWADPTCSALAVRNTEVARGRKLPLCWACIKRRQRWLVSQDGRAS